MNTDLSPIRNYLQRQHDLQLALIFGSLANSTATPNSDADIAIMADAPLSATRRLELIEQLGTITRRPVDLIDLRSAGLPTLRSALSTGQLLFSKDDTAYGRLISRFLIDSADFLPLRQRILDERRAAWIG